MEGSGYGERCWHPEISWVFEQVVKFHCHRWRPSARMFSMRLDFIVGAFSGWSLPERFWQSNWASALHATDC